MCVAIPARVIALQGKNARVSIAGQLQTVFLTIEADVHDWVLIYAGAAIRKVDEDFARESLALLGTTKIPLSEHSD